MKRNGLSDRKITVTVESMEQLEAVLDSGMADICYIDSCYFDVSEYAECVKKAHERGSGCGFRLPQLWRDNAEVYFTACADTIKNVGFDSFMFRNIEALLFFKENGLLNSSCNADDERVYKRYIADHSIYIYNKESVSELMEMLTEAECAEGFCGITLPLELNQRELRELAGSIKEMHPVNNTSAGRDYDKDCPGDVICTELVVYGRAPMMVSSQCVKKTGSRCDKRPETCTLKDRTGALMPVKNCCRFCFNTVYNSVPTVLCDMEREIEDIAPDSLRYEFTTETVAEVRAALTGEKPVNGGFTRGHFKKSVE